MTTCPHGDIYCPCQDGAACHFEGVAALPSPMSVLEAPRCALGLSARRPTWAAVIRAAEAVSNTNRLTRDQILYGRSFADCRARRAVMRKVIADTGCSINGLADVWGLDRRIIQRALREDADAKVQLKVAA